MRWLILERAASSRKRKKKDSKNNNTMATTVVSTKPPTPLQARRNRHLDAPNQLSPVSGKLRKAKDGSHIDTYTGGDRPPMHKRAETAPIMGKLSLEEEQDNSKRFHVANVGAGGTLFLKPSRVAAPHLNYAPATPPATSDGESSVFTDRPDRPLLRESYRSGTWTPRPSRGRMDSIAIPPVSLGNANEAHFRRKTRSHSESTVSDRLRQTQHDFSDFQPPQDEDRTTRRRRRRSSADLTKGLVDVSIPHYRLGVPRFSDRGTAYLHYSLATNSTHGVPSSVINEEEYDRLFPVPPGRGINSFYSHLSAAQSFLHPASAYSRSTVSRTPYESQRPSTVGIITPALFDKLESNLDDRGVVHYHPASGRIAAATPARLIAQITSPQFLDYELLADFFLTYRCFMHRRDVLDFLFARLRWAFIEGNDAGRIARVRTFVALRHWILNYFQDDFAVDALFRQNFCDLVNDLCRSLQERPDRGGGDMNIVSELKKCWRRTCALYWPIPDAHELSVDPDIVPGGDAPYISDAHSSLSLPLTIRPTTRSHSIFEMAQIPLPTRLERSLANAVAMGGPGNRSTATSRTASIPASPMSDQSLEVLSCSVPFLRNLRPTARARERAERAAPPKTLNNEKLRKPKRPVQNHKRSGSFSDALRDHRTPLSSPKADNIELKDLPAFAITGGLVRGILLQPGPARVENNVPVTPGPPGPELTEARLAGHNDGYFGTQHHGVKKFVGEVRRALSSRKASSGSPSRSAGSGSDNESKGTVRLRSRRKYPPDMQQLPGPDRFDMLSVQIETSYSDAVALTAKERARQDQSSQLQLPDPEKAQEYLDEKDMPDTPRAGTPRPVTAHKDDLAVPASQKESVNVMDFGRLNSHNTNVTTGSRSIVIVDATGAPELPMMSGGLQSLGSMSPEFMPHPLFKSREFFPPVPPIPKNLKRTSSQPPMTRPLEWDRWRSSDERMHDLLTTPNPWEIAPRLSRSDSQILRTSSALMDPALFEVPSIPHQLRRQPHGDNLRAANHIHSLHGGLRSRSVDSARVSAATGSVAYSAATQTDESVGGGVMLPARKLLEKKSSVSLLNTHSSQPALRPSFIEEAKALRGIPDVDIEGGIEDALMKLEGKIPSPSNSNASDKEGSDRDSPPGGLPLQEPQEVPLGEEPEGLYDMEPQEVPLGEEPEGIYLEEPLKPPPLWNETANGELKMKYFSIAPTSPSPGQNSGETPATETQGASIYHLSSSGIQSMSSHTDYPLPPTLPPIDIPMTESSASIEFTSRLSRYPIPDLFPVRRSSTPESFPYERKPDSIVGLSSVRYPSFRPGPWNSDNHGSFLLDDHESLSDISTEIADYRNSEEGVRSFYFDEDDPQPIRPFQPLYTPPTTAGGPEDSSSDRKQLIPRLLPRDPGGPLKEAISKPQLQPQMPNLQVSAGKVITVSKTVSPDTRAYPAHLPFVLAYESEVIAEQLTIIEKDALDEVDWKDLISLHWSQNPPYVRNWVEYLDKESANGIDIVIARFNLVVKWCISEIILTEAPSERARAITKYIHIASHCHRMHNYASMYQITLALLSADLARLHRTWSIVPVREKQMLEHLEQLCRPLRNFHTLRAEMETAFAGNGVIPFIGLYTHDLMFNALKSSRIDSPIQGREPLVNFERYQTAATIIKNLLRLIEASSKYDFHPEPEALSKCLWIAALDDDEITQRSKTLEKD